jgi:hypothetical protein
MVAPYPQAILQFNAGGYSTNKAVVAGDTIRQQSATVHATVVSVTVTSGSWTTASPAVGSMVIQPTDGMWVSGQFFDDTTQSASNEAYITSVTVIPFNTSIAGGPIILTKSVKIRRASSDKMYRATFTFNRLTTGGPLSSLFWVPVSFWMPDYTGIWNPVFVGVIPSSQSNVNAYGGDQVMTGYDQGIYLTMQNLPPALLSLPNRPDGTETMTPYVYVLGCLGCPLSFATAPAWEISDGTKWALGTGISPAVTGGFGNPANPNAWGSANLPAIEIPFTTKTTPITAITQICTYTAQLFYTRWQIISGVIQPCAYLADYANIDSGSLGINLPAALNLTNPEIYGAQPAADGSHFLKGPVTLIQKGEAQYNWVTLRYQTLAGVWQQMDSINYGYSDNVYDYYLNPTGTALKRVYYEENTDVTNATDALVRLQFLCNYYFSQMSTWKATFKRRSDLQLYQKIISAGYSAQNLPDGTYRIIDIEYNWTDGGSTNEVTVTFILASAFTAQINIGHVFLNPVLEYRKIAASLQNAILPTVTGTIVSKSNEVAIYNVTVSAGYNIVLTGSGTCPASVGASGTITTVNYTTGAITLTISSTVYNATVSTLYMSSISPGQAVTVQALRGTVTFMSSDCTAAAGKALVKTGYCVDYPNITVNAACIATIDTNGTYIITPA